MSHLTNVLLIPVDKLYDLEYPDLKYIHLNTKNNNIQRNKTRISNLFNSQWKTKVNVCKYIMIRKYLTLMDANMRP